MSDSLLMAALITTMWISIVVGVANSYLLARFITLMNQMAEEGDDE